MNRHHYALFIRNCHLIMLLRREYDEANLNTFSPAEWRWQIPQVSAERPLSDRLLPRCCPFLGG